MVARSAAAALLRVLAGSAGSCTTLGVGPTGTEPFGGSHLLPLLSCLLLAAAAKTEAAMEPGEQGSGGGWSEGGRSGAQRSLRRDGGGSGGREAPSAAGEQGLGGCWVPSSCPVCRSSD